MPPPSGEKHAGLLTSRIALQRKVKATNELGEEVESWEIWKENIPAEVMQTGGTESVVGSQTTVIADYLVTIRFQQGIDETMRVLLDGGILGITNANDVGKRGAWLELTCAEDRTNQGA